jgi:hypothetical protein
VSLEAQVTLLRRTLGIGMVEVEFNCKNGKRVWIEIDDEDDYTARVLQEDGSEIGRLEFRVIDDDFNSFLKLCWAYLDRAGVEFKRQGIGRKCLRLVREKSGLPIIASSSDGHQQGDGSHLTGDAAGFVERMRAEGLIEPDPQDWDTG